MAALNFPNYLNKVLKISYKQIQIIIIFGTANLLKIKKILLDHTSKNVVRHQKLPLLENNHRDKNPKIGTKLTNKYWE